MQRKLDFNPFEWHHEYLGVILLIVNIFWWNVWLFTIGLILVIDGISQLWLGQRNGVLHWIYIRTLYKIKLIREINAFLDRAFKK